jgi:hypothetical protein
MKNTIFFAYESGHADNADAIKRACLEYNTHQSRAIAKTWEDLKVGGRIIDKTICTEISECEVFACDLTYLNHNVMFELGYAVGKQKPVLVLLNTSIDGAEKQYFNMKLLRNIGWEPFHNHRNILSELQRKNKVQYDFLAQITNTDTLARDTYDIFYITSNIKTQASLDLSDAITSTTLKIIKDDSSEVEYQTLYWYLKNLFGAKSVIIHLLAANAINSSVSNAQSSFFAGLACGLGKNVLIMAPSPFKAPIDYTDILIEYHDARDCVMKVKEWLQISSDSFESQPLPAPIQITDRRKDDLLSLGIGCEIAEEEKDKLCNYFIEIDAYIKIQSRTHSIFIGRKGAGKSALFIRLETELARETDSYQIVLKPDSEELLQEVELGKLYNNPASKASFLRTIWYYVFYSKLLISIYEEVVRKVGSLGDKDSIESQIVDYYENNSSLLSVNFYGAIKNVSNMLHGRSIVNDPTMLDDFHKSLLAPLSNTVKKYFHDRRYVALNILADNLDKTWEAKNDLSLQSEMILSLLESTEKFLSDISRDGRTRLKANVVVFLRKDIFDFIRKVSREPDKLTVKSFEISWENRPILLRKLLESRMQYALDCGGEEVEEIWKKYFDFGGREHPFEIIRKHIIERPRDIIYFVSRLFESAINADHAKVITNDLEYAVDAYSTFLHNNLIAELKGEHPKIEEIMSALQTKNLGPFIEYQNFNSIANENGYDSVNLKNLLESLFEKGYLLAVIDGRSMVREVKEIEKVLSERRIFLFRKHRVDLLLNPDQYFIKNRVSFTNKIS